MKQQELGWLDRFRIVAAVLVVANHTSPLDSFFLSGDFWLTRVLARVAVPFFFMVSGYFLAAKGWRSIGTVLKKACLVYGLAVVLYLPLNLYSGSLTPLGWLKELFTDGTLYHLWYFPALILGVLLAWALSRLGMGFALSIAAVLYFIGLGGDSYYGLAVQLPALEAFYSGLFSLFDYTRNGLFFAPLFLLLGAAGFRWGPRLSAAGLTLSLALMSAEGFWLRSMEWQRHDSMYLALPLCMVFLFSLLLSLPCRPSKSLRTLAMLVYLLHPWLIVLVRGGAKLLHLEVIFLDNSLGHFCAVLLATFAAALILQQLAPKPRHPGDRAWREIDLGALVHNAALLQDTLPRGCSLMAVVKADAYGHGAVSVARCLQRHGIHAFAVACLSEGIQLRKAGIRGMILVLGFTPPQQAPLLRRWRLTQTVVDAAHGVRLASAGGRVHVHLALDTGMHRLGIPAEDRRAITRLFQMDSLRIDGVFSHLCVSDSLASENMDYTQGQLDAFFDTVAWIRAQGFDPGALHIQASYGILNLPPQPCRYARAGIALYGVRSDSSPTRQAPDLHPVLALRCRVSTLHTLQPGEQAGYGRAFTARRATKLAVLTIGYADGLPRSLPQHGGQVLLHGCRCPMVGRMCMDQLLVDVTDAPPIRPGDQATLIGRDGDEEIRAEEVAELCGTITNELLSRLGARLDTIFLP